MIGILQPARPACAETHLPGCYNPGLDLTACICGAIWWRGQVGTWHGKQVRGATDHSGMRPVYGAVVGWDVYFLHLAECGQGGTDAAQGHLCRDAEALTVAQAFGGRS